MPSSRTPVFQAQIKSLNQLTRNDAVKTTLEASLELSVKYIHFTLMS